MQQPLKPPQAAGEVAGTASLVSTCYVYFSWPESRKTNCAGMFESCGCQPIMLKITVWPVGRWICELRRQPRKRLRLDLGSSLGPASSQAPGIVADGIVLGANHGRWSA